MVEKDEEVEEEEAEEERLGGGRGGAIMQNGYENNPKERDPARRLDQHTLTPTYPAVHFQVSWGTLSLMAEASLLGYLFLQRAKMVLLMRGWRPQVK